MKLTKHVFALIVVFSVMSLIGCSKDQNSPQAQQQAYAQGVQCGTTPSCGMAWMQANGATPAQIAMAYPNGQLPQNAVGLLPPGSPGTIPVVNPVTPVAGTAPVALPIKDVKRDQDQANRIQRAIASISNNPNSSFYVDPNAQDVPARPSADQIAAASNAIRAATKSPVSTGNSGDSNSTQ
jgi:hypothetical protein